MYIHIYFTHVRRLLGTYSSAVPPHLIIESTIDKALKKANYTNIYTYNKWVALQYNKDEYLL